MSLEFKSNSTGGGGGETLAQTLVIGNTTGPTDIIQTDTSVFRCNDENGLQFASTSGEVHTNGGTSFGTSFNTNHFYILDLVANALFFIRSLASQLYFKIGAELLGNGSVMVIDDDNRISYIDNKDHDIKVGINKAAPTVALDVVGDVNIGNSSYQFYFNASDGNFSIGDENYTFFGVYITGSQVQKAIYFNVLHLKLQLADYASNAAAITGGLTVGDTYRNGADVKIVI